MSVKFGFCFPANMSTVNIVPQVIFLNKQSDSRPVCKNISWSVSGVAETPLSLKSGPRS